MTRRIRYAIYELAARVVLCVALVTLAAWPMSALDRDYGWSDWRAMLAATVSVNAFLWGWHLWRDGRKVKAP